MKNLKPLEGAPLDVFWHFKWYQVICTNGPEWFLRKNLNFTMKVARILWYRPIQNWVLRRCPSPPARPSPAAALWMLKLMPKPGTELHSSWAGGCWWPHLATKMLKTSAQTILFSVCRNGWDHSDKNTKEGLWLMRLLQQRYSASVTVSNTNYL